MKSSNAAILHDSKVAVAGHGETCVAGFVKAGAGASPATAGVTTRCSPGSLVRIEADLG